MRKSKILIVVLILAVGILAAYFAFFGRQAVPPGTVTDNGGENKTIASTGDAKESAMAVRAISPEEAKRNMERDRDIVLLDVRTREEYGAQHIPGAVLIPLAEAAVFTSVVAKRFPDNQAVFYIYCRSGRRSGEAAQMLLTAGYKNVYNLGGIRDWPFATE